MDTDCSAGQLDLDRVRRVFDERGMYDCVVDAGYMRHGEIAAAIASWAQEQGGPLEIVDLGCGDAWLAAHAFGAAAVGRYLGVDASVASVERARIRLEAWGERASVVVGNLADALRALPERSVDLVLASYSIHHFHSDGKAAVLAECGRVLRRGGTMFWIDVVRRDSESREGMIGRLTTAIQSEWTALSQEGRDKACAHIRESDYPETAVWMREHAERAGMRLVRTIFEDEFFLGLMFVR